MFGPASKFPYAADRSYTPPDAPVENLRKLHAKLGISRAVIVHASCHGTDMQVTLDAIASSHDTYRGVACVDDEVTDRELQRLHDGGIRGIRFNFVKHLGGVPDLGVFHRLLARIKPLGWHVVLHFDAEDILTQQELLGTNRRAVHHRPHGSRQGRRRPRSSGRFNCCWICTATIRWRGSRSAARNAFPSVSARFATRCRSHAP